MTLPTYPTAEEIEAALGLLRTKIKAGLIRHKDWPPPARLPIEQQMLRLDRIAREVLEAMRSTNI